MLQSTKLVAVLSVPTFVLLLPSPLLCPHPFCPSLILLIPQDLVSLKEAIHITPAGRDFSVLSFYSSLPPDHLLLPEVTVYCMCTCAFHLQSSQHRCSEDLSGTPVCLIHTPHTSVLTTHIPHTPPCHTPTTHR